jgi:hypothetical protein
MNNKKLLTYPKIFFTFIIVSVSLLSISYAIPNSFLKRNVEISLNVIKEEKISPKPFFNTKSCMLDNHTDRMMFQKAIIENYIDNPLKAAMDVNDYARYWHGYQIFLRPLLTVMSYRSIRYLNMFILFILLCYSFSLIREKIGIGIALAFIISAINVCIFIVPISLTFMSVFVITLISICIILKSTENSDNQIYFSKYFFITGILVSLFDLLTTPLITLGIPLLILLLSDLHNIEEIALKNQFLKIIKYSILWVTGYASFWASKWALGSIILQKNIFKDALNTAGFRINGNYNYPLGNRTVAITQNFNLLSISGDNLTPLLLSILVIIGILFIFYRKPVNKMKNILPLLFVGAYPYVWLYVLASHSQIHARFTYRNQMISIFSVISSIIYLIQWDEVVKTIKKVPHYLFKMVVKTK